MSASAALAASLAREQSSPPACSTDSARQPYAGRKRAATAAKTREKLLIAASDLFAAHGYDAVTIRQVAALAGYSIGAVFGAFTDKADLFTQAMGCRPPDFAQFLRNVACGHFSGPAAKREAARLLPLVAGRAG